MTKLNMKHLITFKRFEPNDGPEAGDGSFQVITKAWAAIRTFQGNEVQAGALTLPVENIRYIIRYQPGIESNMTIEHEGKDYEIINVMNDNEDDKTITIVAKKFGR